MSFLNCHSIGRSVTNVTIFRENSEVFRRQKNTEVISPEPRDWYIYLIYHKKSTIHVGKYRIVSWILWNMITQWGCFDGPPAPSCRSLMRSISAQKKKRSTSQQNTPSCRTKTLGKTLKVDPRLRRNKIHDGFILFNKIIVNIGVFFH